MPREMPVAWSNLLDALKSWQAPYYESRAQALQKAKMEGDWRMEGARLSEQRRASMAQEDIQRGSLAEQTRHNKETEEMARKTHKLAVRTQAFSEQIQMANHHLDMAIFWHQQRLANAAEAREQDRFEWEQTLRPTKEKALELQNQLTEIEKATAQIDLDNYEKLTELGIKKIEQDIDTAAALADKYRAEAFASRQLAVRRAEGAGVEVPDWEKWIQKNSGNINEAYQRALNQTGYLNSERGEDGDYEGFVQALELAGVPRDRIPTEAQFQVMWDNGSLPGFMKGQIFRSAAEHDNIWAKIPQGAGILDVWMPPYDMTVPEGGPSTVPTLRDKFNQLDDFFLGPNREVLKDPVGEIKKDLEGIKEQLKGFGGKIKNFFKGKGGPQEAEGAVLNPEILEQYRQTPYTPPSYAPQGEYPSGATRAQGEAESTGGQFGQQFLERQVTPLGGGAVNPDAIQQHRQSTPQKQGPAPPSVPPYGQMPEQQQPPGSQVNPSVLDRFFNRPPQGSVNPNAIQRGGYQPPSPWQAPRPNPSDMQPMQPPRGQFNQQTFDRFKRTTPLGGQVNPDAIQTERYRPPESFQPYRPNPASIESMQRPEQQGQFGRDFMNVQRTPQGSVNPEAVGRYRQGYQPPESYQPPRPAASQYSPIKREGPRTRSQPEVKSVPQTAEQAPREEPRPPVVDQRGPYVEQPPEVIDRTEQDTRGPAAVQPEEERGLLGRIGEKVKGAIGDIFNLDNTEEQIVEYEGDVYVVKKDGRVFTVDGQEVTQESFKSNIIRKMMKDQEKAKEAETQQKQQQRRFMGIERR